MNRVASGSSLAHAITIDAILIPDGTKLEEPNLASDLVGRLLLIGVQTPAASFLRMKQQDLPPKLEK